ncbi:MAG: hypothetical protein PWR06_2850, partial [Thermoanaerobacteraceae bacterium]|nr:hypothetical protein [Thermoanaerobacteraceae bacterium]
YLTVDTLAVWLMVAAASPIADFHCRAIAHAGRTRNREQAYAVLPVLFIETSAGFYPLENDDDESLAPVSLLLTAPTWR